MIAVELGEQQSGRRGCNLPAHGNGNEVPMHDERTLARARAQYYVTDTGCWQWTGHLQRGYGRLKVGDRMRSAHRFFYEALVGPIPEGLQIDHLCRNRACVNPDHLEPVTNRENCLRGDTPKLTPEIIQDIREAGAKVPDGVIAERHGISATTVSRVRSGRSWADEDAPVVKSNRVRKLSDADVDEIRRMHAEGRRRVEIARIFGVSGQCIDGIVTWKSRTKRTDHEPDDNLSAYQRLALTVAWLADLGFPYNWSTVDPAPRCLRKPLAEVYAERDGEGIGTHLAAMDEEQTWT